MQLAEFFFGQDTADGIFSATAADGGGLGVYYKPKLLLGAFLKLCLFSSISLMTSLLLIILHLTVSCPK